LPIIPNKDLFRNPAYCAAAKPDAKLTIGCKIVLTLCLSCRNILGYRVMPHNWLGWLFQFRAKVTPLHKGKSFTEETFMATKKKAKKKKH
jgi:hypothetical protein